MSGFQSVMYQQPAYAVEGDFAGAGPYDTVIPTPGQLRFVAGTGGALVGRFGWADINGNVTNAGSGAPTGFIGRKQGDARLWNILTEQASMTIPQGYEMTLFNIGPFFVRATVAGATKGQKAFASNTDGSVQFAAAGATVAGYTETKWIAAAPASLGELVPITTWS